MMRVVLSAWNRRLCPLQEGVLSKKLMFQLYDRALSLEHLESRIEHNTARWQPVTWQVNKPCDRASGYPSEKAVNAWQYCHKPCNSDLYQSQKMNRFV
jgi:hypothetical protein